MKKLKVIILDDSEIFRYGVKNVLEEERNMQIWEATGSAELFSLLKANKIDPDIILLDVKLKLRDSLSGIEIARKLKAEYPNIKIIILTAFDEESILRQAMFIGVDGFLPKESVPDEIIEAIHSVIKGKNYLGKTIPFKNIKNAFKNKKRKYDVLTKTEKKIFTLISKGTTNQEIADKLFISIHTVETHKSNIKNKLNIKSDVDFLAIAIDDEIEEVMTFYKLQKNMDL